MSGQRVESTKPRAADVRKGRRCEGCCDGARAGRTAGWKGLVPPPPSGSSGAGFPRGEHPASARRRLDREQRTVPPPPPPHALPPTESSWHLVQDTACGRHSRPSQKLLELV